jgi:mannan endo-1,4-beta-mannosidase
LEDVSGLKSETLTDGVFVNVKNGDNVSFPITVPISQHYTLTLNAKSEGDGVITVKTPTDTLGVYYITKTDISYGYSIQNIYLSGGKTDITLECRKGEIKLDSFSLKESSPCSPDRYNVSMRLANTSASDIAAEVYGWLIDGYGSQIITGAEVTAGTDAELNAIYGATGRYPAMRVSDLGKYSRTYAFSDKNEFDDIPLAVKYANKGGLIAYKWSWYAPMGGSSYLADKTGFSLDKAKTARDIYALSPEKLIELRDNSDISAECYELILDIDDIASYLKILQEKEIAVFFEPLYQAGLKRYWWGESADGAVWLWKLLFNRFSEYHALGNIIWVWTGEDKAYYPGDEYVDIVGEGVYSAFDGSNAGKFNMSLVFPNRLRTAAATEMSVFPNPDVLWRDNTMWSFAVTASGSAVIKEDGTFTGDANAAAQLKYAYNHTLTIARDEVPRFGTGFEDVEIQGNDVPETAYPNETDNTSNASASNASTPKQTTAKKDDDNGNNDNGGIEPQEEFWDDEL